jgi:hypothetical protein
MGILHLCSTPQANPIQGYVEISFQSNMRFAVFTHPCDALMLSMTPVLVFPENYAGRTVFANERIVVPFASDTLSRSPLMVKVVTWLRSDR